MYVMYVCMCVCMNVLCIYVCVYVRMYVCMYVCKYVCMYVCIDICMCACVCVCLYYCVQFGYLQLVFFIILTSPAILFKCVCDICLVTKTNIVISTTYIGFSAPDVICATLNWSSSKKANEKNNPRLLVKLHAWRSKVLTSHGQFP